MICKEPLSAAQLASSQRNLHIFSLINGFSYMCLGETVLILLAVRIGSPDFIVAILGAMIYFGFLLLPLGKVVTARVGAAKCQSYFWVARNIAALLVALSAIAGDTGMKSGAFVLLLAGSFFFYGFRAAGAVMAQPLIGGITTDQDRSKVIGVNFGFFYLACLITLVAICLLLKINDSLGVLTGIIVAGALSGFTASHFIVRVDEAEEIRESARQPLRGELRKVWNDKVLIRLLFSGFALNLAVIMLIPVSMLALKRGYGISDTHALLYALAQFGTSAAASFFSGAFSNRFGPRKVILYSFSILTASAMFWVFAPERFHPVYMALPFLLMGGGCVAGGNALTHYFLQTIPRERQVASAMLISVMNGAGSGILGMLLAGMLISLCHEIAPNSTLLGYRLYFGTAFLLLTCGIQIISRLAPLPSEKRKLRKNWREAF